MRRGIYAILSLLTLIGTTTCSVEMVQATDFLLTLETDPLAVLAIDPQAVSSGGTYASGNLVVIDAKQTVVSGNARYEFTGWSHNDNSAADPEEDPELIGNQVYIFMDSSRTVTAFYEIQPNIRVSVKTKRGLLLDGASVLSTSQPTGQTALKGTTNTIGVIQFNGVKSGTYTIQAFKSGYDANSTTVFAAAGSTANVIITLQEATTTSMKVTVIEANGKPIPGVKVVFIIRPIGQPSLSVLTDNTGVAQFTGILPGKYKLSLSKTGYATTSLSVSVTLFGKNEFTAKMSDSKGGPESVSEGIPGFPAEASAVAVLFSLLAMYWRSRRACYSSRSLLP